MAFVVLEEHEIEALLCKAVDQGIAKGIALAQDAFRSVQKKEENKGVLINQKEAAQRLSIDVRTFKKNYLHVLTRVNDGAKPKFYLSDVLELKDKLAIA